MNLKQKGLKISGSKTELIDRVLTHARGNLSARDAAEDEESPNSCEDDTSSEFSDSDALCALNLFSRQNQLNECYIKHPRVDKGLFSSTR